MVTTIVGWLETLDETKVVVVSPEKVGNNGVQHGVNIMAVEVQIGVALDVVEEEAVDPGEVEMVMNVSNGMPCYMLQVL